MKAIDSNLLVYASLQNHPASNACERYLAAEPLWLTNIVNLIELHRVLIGVYGVSERDADTKFTDFQQALVIEDLTANLATASLPLRQAHGIDFNDAVLLQTCCQRGVSHLATDDTRLAAAATALKIAVENPISAALAADFHSASQGLSRLV